MALSDRDKRAVVWGGGLLGLVVVYRLLLSPLLAGWSEAKADGALYTQRLEQLEDKLDTRDAQRKNLRPRYGDAVDGPVRPLDDVRVTFPKAVQEAMGRAGLKPQQVEVQGVRRLRGVPNVSSLSLRVRATGNDSAIPRVLGELRKCGHVVVVESIDLSMADPNRRDQWQLVMTVSTPALDMERKS